MFVDEMIIQFIVILFVLQMKCKFWLSDYGIKFEMMNWVLKFSKC